MYTEKQIEKLAPKDSAFKAGKKLAVASKWDTLGQSDAAIWGSIRGSGKKPYLVQVDTSNIAYKCTCPSRQFPCKHAIGLLLVHSQGKSAFTENKEPEYVSEWINKRAVRAMKIDKEEKEISAKEKESRAAAKSNRQEDKLKLTLAGVAELKLWLKDLVRIGILELPNRPATYFESMMERMVDAKAPGLAGWVKGLKNLPYKNQQVWQEKSLATIAKLFLLIKATEHLGQYTWADQKAIKGLLGWTYNQKELSADKDSLAIKDNWLILGSHVEEQEELTVIRYWLHGSESRRDAIIIRFQSKFTAPDQIPIVEGTTIEAELIFYPGLEPHRAFISKQKVVHNNLSGLPHSQESWETYQNKLIQITQKNPWSNNRADIIAGVHIMKGTQSLLAVDKNKNYRKISADLDDDSASTLLLNSIGKTVHMSFVHRQDGILPLGLFMDDQYKTL